MNDRASNRARAPYGRSEAGVALAIVLVLLAAIALAGTTGLATATLERRMAVNAAEQQRAFDAAEYAIARALASPDLSSDWRIDRPRVEASSRGADEGEWSYRLWYDIETDPYAPADREAGLRAHHFVVEAVGRAGRGAVETHLQGFYVLTPAPAPVPLTPPRCAQDCAPGLFGPHRTWWLQQGAE